MTLRARFGRRRSGAGTWERALRDGSPVGVPCRLRRTSARGWGPWTQAIAVLGSPPAGHARWTTDDAVSVGFASTNERVDLPFEEVAEVYLRSVRFRTEAFWGMDNDIVVVVSERDTIELAVPPGVAVPLAGRLSDLLLPGAG